MILKNHGKYTSKYTWFQKKLIEPFKILIYWNNSCKVNRDPMILLLTFGLEYATFIKYDQWPWICTILSNEQLRYNPYCAESFWLLCVFILYNWQCMIILLQVQTRLRPLSSCLMLVQAVCHRREPIRFSTLDSLWFLSVSVEFYDDGCCNDLVSFQWCHLHCHQETCLDWVRRSLGTWRAQREKPSRQEFEWWDRLSWCWTLLHSWPAKCQLLFHLVIQHKLPGWVTKFWLLHS